MRTIICLIFLFSCTTASAALWNVESVLSGTDGNFGFSSLHDADDSTPMSGSQITTVNTATGLYDDSNGSLSLVLGLGNGRTMTLDGILDFGADGFLAADSTLAYTGLTNMKTSGNTDLPEEGGVGFMPGDSICCNSTTFKPNSFQDSGSGGIFLMTLWGADYQNSLTNAFSGSYDGSTFGIDLRLELSEVPVPAAVWLFGTALLGLFGYQRRKARA